MIQFVDGILLGSGVVLAIAGVVNRNLILAHILAWTGAVFIGVGLWMFLT